MNNIIYLENYQKRNMRKYTPTKTVEIPNENNPITDFIEYTVSKRSGIQNRLWQIVLDQREKEEQKEFEEKYEDILATAPSANEAKLQYFADVMLNMLPSVFHGNQKDKSFSDFSMFYFSEFDYTFFDYRNENKIFEKNYPFQFSKMDADELENALQDCLRQITNCNDKTEIMWQASRFFELYHNMLDFFNF